MESRELNKLLLNSFPELKERFDIETEWQEGIDTGSTIVFEDVFIPFLEVNVESNNIKTVDRIFSFIEDLALVDDQYAQNVLIISILENINDFIDKHKFIAFFKENTLKLYNQFFN